MENNKKGVKGYIIGYWNTHGSDVEPTRSGQLEIAVTHVEVMSCGKQQMTLLNIADEDMTRTFHAPDRPIYTTIEEAEVVAKEMYLKWLEKSIEATKRVMISGAKYHGHYAWWPKQKEKHQLFLNDLNAGKIDYAIIER